MRYVLGILETRHHVTGKIGLIYGYSRAQKRAALQNYEKKHSISIRGRLGMWHCLCETRVEGVLRVSEVKTAESQTAYRGK